MKIPTINLLTAKKKTINASKGKNWNSFTTIKKEDPKYRNLIRTGEKFKFKPSIQVPNFSRNSK